MIEQGFEQLKQGQFEEAIATFSAVHALSANDDRPLRGRGLAYIQLSSPDSAASDFKRATELNAVEPENWMGLGVSLALQNRVYEALEVYEDLISKHPNFVPGYLQMARLQFKIGAISKGKDFLKEALQHRPDLTQRRTIEALLKEQERLDKGRYYRPDFVRLEKQSMDTKIAGSLKKLFERFKNRKSRRDL